MHRRFAQAGSVLARAFIVALAFGSGSLAGAPEPAAAYATAMGQAVNAYRASNGLRALDLDPALSLIAQGHSVAMARAGKMNHDGFPDRAQRSGLPMCVENVGWNYPTPQAQFDAWRASPGHDRNMRHPRVERMGVGAADGYVTLVICGP